MSGGEEGHCRKTESIFRYFWNAAQTKNWKWLVVTDDDTMLSVSKVLDLIRCYDRRAETEPVAIGERYGRGYAISQFPGFDFLAGGSGMIFNVRSVRRIVRQCRCPNVNFGDDRPDDIHLGACLDDLKIPIIHSNRLHQVTYFSKNNFLWNYIKRYNIS
jgi:UDP-glucose:O-linked fucose beta-1,3-glucosyltransferase